MATFFARQQKRHGIAEHRSRLLAELVPTCVTVPLATALSADVSDGRTDPIVLPNRDVLANVLMFRTDERCLCCQNLRITPVLFTPQGQFER